MMKFLALYQKGARAEAQHNQTVVKRRYLFWRSTEVKTLTKRTTRSNVLNIENDPITQGPFSLEEYLQTGKEDYFCRKCAESVADPQSCIG